VIRGAAALVVLVSVALGVVRPGDWPGDDRAGEERGEERAFTVAVSGFT